MREILFRGKRIDNGQWVEGYLFDDGLAESSQFFIGSIVIEKEEGTAAYDYCITGRDFYAVSLETIGQYTGMVDKNGKKIFEGDILINDSDKVGKIIYSESDLAFLFLEKEENEYYYIQGYNGCYVRIIGNIFDNPEYEKIREMPVSWWRSRDW